MSNDDSIANGTHAAVSGACKSPIFPSGRTSSSVQLSGSVKKSYLVSRHHSENANRYTDVRPNQRPQRVGSMHTIIDDKYTT